MKEGFYRIEYWYKNRQCMGFGIMVLDTDILTGVDIVGIKFDGTYGHNAESGEVEASVEAVTPKGGAILVTGDKVEKFNFKIRFPKKTPGTPFTININGKLIQANISFLRDFSRP